MYVLPLMVLDGCGAKFAASREKKKLKLKFNLH